MLLFFVLRHFFANKEYYLRQYIKYSLWFLHLAKFFLSVAGFPMKEGWLAGTHPATDKKPCCMNDN